MNEIHDAMFLTQDKAPEGKLKWLRVEDSSAEEIPSEEGLFYDLLFDERGGVFPGLVVRDADNKPVAGVALSFPELITFARWAFENAVAHTKFMSMQVGDVGTERYLKDHIEGLMSFVKGQLPEPFEAVMKDYQQDMIQKAVERAERDAEARVRSEAEAEIKVLQHRHAQHVVQLSKIATLPVGERDEALDDPILQDVILKAVQVADSKRES